jgi:two-component sensor histidine kinase
LLLKEVHHRVKNNMQVVSSLLNLQASTVEEPKVRALLRDSQNRVKTMALIHEELYRAHNLGRIEFAHFMRCLASDLLRSYGVQDGRVQMQIDADSVWLGVDTAIPCGLIVNELLAHRLVHAFPEGRGGVIRVALQHKGKEVVLTVADNGVGFPADFDLATTESLGLQLVMTLVEQLEGNIALRSDGAGSEFCIAFKEPEVPERTPEPQGQGVGAARVEVAEVEDGNGGS